MKSSKTKLDPKQLNDARKLQGIIDHIEQQPAKQRAKEMNKRKKLFNKVVQPIDEQTAISLRTQQDDINSQASLNPLADMCHALGKCFQCGKQFDPTEHQRQKDLHKPGLIFLCEGCWVRLENAKMGDMTAPMDLPYAATKQCEDEYQAMAQQMQAARTMPTNLIK
jgi:hypothetical protein